MTLHVQFMTIIMMVSGGFYLGMALDTFRRFSWHWKKRAFLKYFLEIGFWLVQSLILFYVLYRVNNGELRLYVFLSCLLGFATYQALASNIYKQLLESIVRILRTIYRFFERLIQVLVITPIVWILKTIYMMVLWVIRLVMTVLLWVLSTLFYPIRRLVGFIYQRSPKKIHHFLYKFVRIYSTIKHTCIKWLQFITFKRR